MHTNFSELQIFFFINLHRKTSTVEFKNKLIKEVLFFIYILLAFPRPRPWSQ